MIRPFLTSVRCLKGLGQKGSQEPNDEDLEKMKKASLGISPIYNLPNLNMIAPFLISLG